MPSLRTTVMLNWIADDAIHHGSTGPETLFAGRFGSALGRFLESAQRIVNSGHNAIGILPPRLEPRAFGTGLMRIVAVYQSPDLSSLGPPGLRAWAFVCLSTGDVLKPVGWSAAHPIERGNIFDSQNGTGGCDWSGPV